MRWAPDDIAASTGGSLRRPEDGPELVLTGFNTDSRDLQPGQMFVAVRAERDGHDFIVSALAAGAGGVLVDRADRIPQPVSVPFILVEDTTTALLDIGAHARDRVDVPVVGITGSVGKTAVKDLAEAALSATLRTSASYRSFNNELGVPLTLANAAEDTEVFVIEMGARGPGHVALLARTARPTIGVVTAVAAAHTEMFGSLDAVAQAKGELVEALTEDGTAVLNGDDRRVMKMAAKAAGRVITYSASDHPVVTADFVATDIHLDDQLRPRFTATTPWGRAEVRLEARGLHQVGNALAALAVATLCGVDLEVASAGMRKARMSPWRMELNRSRSGATILNDAYNANPASMEAALRALAALPAKRKVAVLGVMAELGDESDADHRAAADLAADLGVSLIAIGIPAYGVEPVPDLASAVAALGPLDGEVAVLIKASRVAGLEKLAARLLEI